MTNGKQTVVEDGTELRGTLTSTCPIVVRGRVEGDIETPSLVVSENGAVHGRAKVGALRSQGEISGEFEAETVELGGKVRDKTIIRARTLEVKLAGEDAKYRVTFGECELSVGDVPVDDASAVKVRKGPGPRREGKAAPAVTEEDLPPPTVVGPTTSGGEP